MFLSQGLKWSHSVAFAARSKDGSRSLALWVVSVWQRRSGKLSPDSSVKEHALHGYSQDFISCECTTLFSQHLQLTPTTGSTAQNGARASLWPHSQERLMNKFTALCPETSKRTRRGNSAVLYPRSCHIPERDVQVMKMLRCTTLCLEDISHGFSTARYSSVVIITVQGLCYLKAVLLFRQHYAKVSIYENCSSEKEHLPTSPVMN